MPATYEPIATTTLGSAASTIAFNSITGSYTDIRLILVGTSSANYTNIYMRFNSDSGTNYSETKIFGNGSTASSNRQSNSNQIQINYNGMITANPTLYEVDIFSYAGSTNKTALATGSEDYNGSSFGTTNRTVGLWRNTAAITSISLNAQGGNFATGTTATLYGILKA